MRTTRWSCAGGGATLASLRGEDVDGGFLHRLAVPAPELDGFSVVVDSPPLVRERRKRGML